VTVQKEYYGQNFNFGIRFKNSVKTKKTNKI
jgi:hypothetical protein